MNLRADFLEPFADVIARTSSDGDEVQCLLASWAIINMVPLRQFPPSELHVCFYEDIFNDPHGQLRALYDFADRTGQRTEIDLGANVVERPSRVAGGAARW